MSLTSNNQELRMSPHFLEPWNTLKTTITIGVSYPSQIQKLTIRRKRTWFDKSFTKKKFRKFWWKLKKWPTFFLNLANFVKHTFLTLAPPSHYALNLKALIKVSKVSWTSQLSYEIHRSSFERKFAKANFISPKKTPPKSPHRLGLNWPKNINMFEIQQHP